MKYYEGFPQKKRNSRNHPETKIKIEVYERFLYNKNKRFLYKNKERASKSIIGRDDLGSWDPDTARKMNIKCNFTGEFRQKTKKKEAEDLRIQFPIRYKNDRYKTIE